MGGGEGLDSRPGAGVGLGSVADRVGALGVRGQVVARAFVPVALWTTWWKRKGCVGGGFRAALGSGILRRLAGVAARGRPGGFSCGGSGPWRAARRPNRRLLSGSSGRVCGPGVGLAVMS